MEEGKSIKVDITSEDGYYIVIPSGPAAGSRIDFYFNIKPPTPDEPEQPIEPDEPIIPEDKLITITIPDSELYKVLKTRIWNIEDSNDELQTITTHESVIKEFKEIDLSSGHNIKTLNGISNFPNLETIKLKYCYELEDISDILNLENIKEIYVCQQNKIDFTPILESQFNNNLAIITDNDYAIYSYPDIELQEYMYKILELSNGAFEANIYYDIEEYWPFNIINEEDKQQAIITIDNENRKIKLKYDNKLTEEHPNKFRKIEFIITEGPFSGTRYSQIYEVTEIVVKQDAKRIMYLEGDNFEEEGLEFLILNEDGEYVEVDGFEVLDGENLSIEKNWVDIMLNSNPELIYEYWIDLYKEEWTIKIQVEDEKLYNALKSKDTCSKPIEEEWETESQFYESLISCKDDEKILYLNDEILQHVEYIDLSNKNIENISGLEKIYNLQNINLSGNTQLDSVDNLSQLERLNTVILNNTSVENISILLEKESVQKIEISKEIEDIVILENSIIELPNHIYQLLNEEGITIDAYISNYDEEEIEGTIVLAEKVDIEIVDGKAIIKIQNHESEEKIKLSLMVNGGKADQSTFDAKYQLPKIEAEKLEIDFINYNEQEGLVSNIDAGTKIEQFKKAIQTNGEVQLYTKDSQLIETDEELATGMKIKISFGEESKTYTLAVTGDCNGDGKVRVGDLTTMMVSIAENLAANKDTSKILGGAWLKAVDLNADEKLSVSDITMLKILIVENK